MHGVPVLLTDTAGVRSSSDKIEQLGIERTRRAIVDADLVVVVLDGAQPATHEDREVLAEAAETRCLIALNKSDLEAFDERNAPLTDAVSRFVSVSAKTGAGLDDLCAAIMEPFAKHDTYEAGFLITNARHYDLLRRSADALRRTQELIRKRASEELLLVGLYDALRSLGEITGETTPEDVLSQIFSTFCIGK
jgi:tRNA modification GTPase